MRGLLTWVDGRLVPSSEAVVSVYDRAFRAGDGVFETLRAYEGHPFRLPDHLRRAAAGARVLGFDIEPLDELAEAVVTTARENLAALGGGDSVLRLTVTPGKVDPSSPFPGSALDGKTVVVTCQPLAEDPAAARDGVAAVTVPWSRPLPHIKPVAYLMAAQAHREANRRGASEGLLTDLAGDVLEGSGSNVFAVVGGALVTPPLSAGLLPGITRATVKDVAPGLGLEVHERSLPRDMLLSADEAFLTATTREVVPLVTVDGAAIGSGRPGPVTARVRDGLRDEVVRERAAGVRGG